MAIFYSSIDEKSVSFSYKKAFVYL